MIWYGSLLVPDPLPLNCAKEHSAHRNNATEVNSLFISIQLKNKSLWKTYKKVWAYFVYPIWWLWTARIVNIETAHTFYDYTRHEVAYIAKERRECHFRFQLYSELSRFSDVERSLTLPKHVTARVSGSGTNIRKYLQRRCFVSCFFLFSYYFSCKWHLRQQK